MQEPQQDIWADFQLAEMNRNNTGVCSDRLGLINYYLHDLGSILNFLFFFFSNYEIQITRGSLCHVRIGRRNAEHRSL